MVFHRPTGVPVVVDVEASGFGAGSYPIEVGAVLPDGTSSCFLVRPEPEWTHWDPEAAAVHGIAREQLLDVGLPVQEVAELINHAIDGRVAYSDGWGVDRSWIALLYAAAGTAQKFRLETIRALLDDEQAARWADVKAQVTRELALHRHRASTDAKIIQMTYQRVAMVAAES